ncbi:MAG: isoprenylcysteine carboxylmethyltransferase family protein [Alphaproteobacteria bacterium]|nr:isoprenylcysteine carboxylmethyltransferase family protein [Alphaproteobacteria bacterium]
MSYVFLIISCVASQRLLELVLANHNTTKLMAQGGQEFGKEHYPFIVLLHASWLLSLFLFVPSAAPINIPLLLVFIVLQSLRIWVIASLGPYWTTRIISLPQAPLIKRGPYRFLRHPNYWVVIAEIAVLPLVFGAWKIALVYSLLNAILMRYRIRIEEESLALHARD